MPIYYDPEVYGWSQMTAIQKRIARTTVYENIRQDVLFFVNGIPVHTVSADTYVPKQFLPKALQLANTFCPHGDCSVFAAMYSSEDGYLPYYFFDRVQGELYFSERDYIITMMVPSRPKIAQITKTTNYLSTLKGPEVGWTEPRVGAYHAANVAGELKVVVEVGMKNPLVLVRRTDIENLVALKTASQRVINNMKDAQTQRMINCLEIVDIDKEISSLPLASAAPAGPPAMTENELIKLFEENVKIAKADRKGKGKLPKAPAPAPKPSKKQAFVAPEKIPVIRMRTKEALELINRHQVSNYHSVCPEWTHSRVRPSYVSAFQCRGGQTPTEMRRRRDDAIACALLRTKVGHSFADNGVKENHKIPISLCWALATGCSKRLGHSENEKDLKLARWLMLKGGIIGRDERGLAM